MVILVKRMYGGYAPTFATTCQAEHMGLGSCSEPVQAAGYACERHWSSFMAGEGEKPRRTTMVQDMPCSECGAKPYCRGYCRNHYQRHWRRGDFR